MPVESRSIIGNFFIMNAKIHIIFDVPDYLFREVPDYLFKEVPDYLLFKEAFDY